MPLIATSHTSLDFDSAFLARLFNCCIILLHLLVLCSCAIARASPSSCIFLPSHYFCRFPCSLAPKPITPVLSCAYSQLGICPFPTSFPCICSLSSKRTPSNPHSIQTHKYHPQPFTNCLLLASKSRILELGWIKMFFG